MAKTDDLISWAIMNSPVPLEAERPRPTPLFDVFSGHMREIAEHVISERAPEDLPTRLEGWDWDVYAQAFRVTMATKFPGPILDVTGKFELKLDGADEWRTTFNAFGDEVDAFLVEVVRIRAALKAHP